MGCQTGFYFLFDRQKLDLPGAIALLRRVFAQAAEFPGEMPGQSAKECGNYVNLDVALGRAACAFYSSLIAHWTEADLAYPTAP